MRSPFLTIDGQLFFYPGVRRRPAQVFQPKSCQLQTDPRWHHLPGLDPPERDRQAAEAPHEGLGREAKPNGRKRKRSNGGIGERPN